MIGALQRICLCCLGRCLVEQVQFFAGFEADGFAGGDAYLGAGARVASYAGLAGFDIEHTEPAKLDAVTLTEGALHGFEDGIDSRFRLDAW